MPSDKFDGFISSGSVHYLLRELPTRMGDFFPALGSHIIIVCKK